MIARMGVAAAMAAVALSSGCPSAVAQIDFTNLLIDPNAVTDSTAFLQSGPPTINPNGQTGASTVFTHRDNTRQITDTVLVLPDAAAAAAALGNAKATLGGTVVGQTTPAAVGQGGTLVTGASPDQSKSVTVLLFTQGNALATLEFEGPPNDPVPADVVTDMGQAQVTAIENGLPA